MSVMLLRVTTGEDIVAEIKENENTITLENPAVLMPMRDAGGGNMQMGFGPWVPFAASSKVKVDIDREKVMFIIEPNSDIANNYRQAFGSGIVVPPKATTQQVLT